jgi:hypothetical protein
MTALDECDTNPSMNLVRTILPLLLLGACVADTTDESAQDSTGDAGHGAPEPKLDDNKDAHAAHGHHGTGSPLLTWGGGGVLHGTKTQAIFWGSEWSSASFAGDKLTGLDSFFSGYSGSNFAGTVTEYYDSTGHVSNQSTYLGHTIDTSAAPSKAITVSQGAAEACKITNNNPDPSAVYFIYTSTGAGQVSYCAWHSWGNCSNGAPVQFAYMPNIDGLAGCDPGDTSTGHSQGLAAVANVTSHELSEAITDPRGTGWTDSSGAENGDKCAWTFTGTVTLKNGSKWKLQQEWSNNAYNAVQGNPRGCIQGQ